MRRSTVTNSLPLPVWSLIALVAVCSTVSGGVEPPLSLTWRVPWYRDTVYASQRIEAVELRIDVKQPDSVLEHCGIHTEVVGDAAGVFWRELRLRPIHPVQATNIVRLDSSVMARGRHELRVFLHDTRDRHLVCEGRTTVRKMAPGAVEVCPSPDGTLLVNSVPVFALALATGGEQALDLQRLAAAGQNALVPVTVTGKAGLERLLTAAHGHGLGVIAPFPNALGHDADVTAAEQAVRRYRASDTLWAWRLDAARGEVPRVVLDRFVECSPYRPLFAAAPQASADATTAEVLAIVPAVEESVLSGVDFGTVLAWADTIAARAGRGRPTWAVVPLHLARRRRPDMLRLMSWLAVAAGARGVVFDAVGREKALAPFHASWRRLAGVVGEMRQVQAGLEGGTAKELTVHGSIEVRAAARHAAYRWLVVAVNPTARRAPVRLQVADLPPGTRLRVLSEDRWVTAEAGDAGPDAAVIVDRIGPTRARIYTTLPRLEP